MLKNLPVNPRASEFYDLPADADDRARQGVAERLVPYARLLRRRADGRLASFFAGVRIDRRPVLVLASRTNAPHVAYGVVWALRGSTDSRVQSRASLI
jgi:hypothetical protein